jgi:hypothetical protein
MSDGSRGRRCAKTGLQLIPEGGERTFRVAKPKYGALSAPLREASSNFERWGRFDSLGSTLYVANDEETSYAEVLAPFKRQIGIADPLEGDAAAVGLKREEFLEIIAQEWQEANFMGVGAIPRQWRTDRLMYQVYGQGDGWYIDVEHPDTLSVLEEQLHDVLASEGVKTLTTAVLRGENRRITTAVGGLLRLCELDVGKAKGIEFGSKFGGGWCRAIWVPAEGQDWTVDIVALSGEPILVIDEHLARASERFRIRVF